MSDEKKATAEDVIVTLRSIDASLKLLTQHFGCNQHEHTANGPAAMATDADLDGKYGNPEVKAKDPRDWTGDNMNGKKFSECPPAYLDLVASRLDFFIEKTAQEAADAANSDEREALKKKNHYQKLDAARARGWAARIRAGYVAPAVDAAAFPSDDTGIDSSNVPF